MDTIEFVAFGEHVSAGEYVRAQFERENIARAYTDFFARTRVDLPITPTLGLEAFPLGTRHPDVVGDVKITPP